jgi:hypothetical protein
MPEEPIHTPNGEMDAFLIESRSIGGLSGSPVFVSLGGVRGSQISQFKHFWLGLMHGHWERTAPELDLVGPNDERLNTGIAVVVPAYEILEVLNQDMLVESRRAEAHKRQHAEAPVPDDEPMNP